MNFEEDPGLLLYLVSAMKGGASYEEALKSLKNQEPKAHPWVEAAVLLSRETGGSLVPLLESAARTFQQKKEFKDKVRALSAQGLASAWVVGLTPVGLLSILALLSWDSVAVLFNTRAGNLLLLAAGVLVAAGFWTARRLVRLEDL